MADDGGAPGFFPRVACDRIQTRNQQQSHAPLNGRNAPKPIGRVGRTVGEDFWFLPSFFFCQVASRPKDEKRDGVHFASDSSSSPFSSSSPAIGMRRWSRPSTDLISAGKLVFVYLVRAVKLETDYAKQTTNGSPLDFISVDILVVCFYSPGRSNWKVITQKKPPRNQLEIGISRNALNTQVWM